MVSRNLLIFFAISMCIYSIRAMGPSPQAMESPRKVYIVHTDETVYQNCDQYLLVLGKVLDGSSPEDEFVYCYDTSMTGFAARLTDEEANKLRGERGIQEVQGDVRYRIDDPISFYH